MPRSPRFFCFLPGIFALSFSISLSNIASTCKSVADAICFVSSWCFFSASSMRPFSSCWTKALQTWGNCSRNFWKMMQGKSNKSHVPLRAWRAQRMRWHLILEHKFPACAANHRQASPAWIGCEDSFALRPSFPLGWWLPISRGKTRKLHMPHGSRWLCGMSRPVSSPVAKNHAPRGACPSIGSPWLTKCFGLSILD